MTQNVRSTTLRRYRAELEKLRKATHEAYVQAEDTLTELEDRESRRATRTTGDQARLDSLRNSMGGRGA